MQVTPARRNLVVFVVGVVLFALALTYRLTRRSPVTAAPAPVASTAPADTSLAEAPSDTMARFPPRAATTLPAAPPMTKPVVPDPQQATPATTAPLPARKASAAPPPVADEQPKEEPARQPACDQLVTRDGDLIDVHVTEVGVSEVRYKRCGRKDGPDYVVLKRDILSIRYPNGEVERFTP